MYKALYSLNYSTLSGRRDKTRFMQVFALSDDTPLPPDARGGAWLIGNFDGVHKGHKAMIAAIRAQYGSARVLTFSPHPRVFFGAAVQQITTLPEKQALLEALGVDVLVVRSFDAAFAAHSAEDFITRILMQQLDAAVIAVGADFRFGQGRQGDVGLLQKHMKVHVFEPFCDEAGQVYSSTRIRQALAAGDVALAEKLLGHKVKPAI